MASKTVNIPGSNIGKTVYSDWAYGGWIRYDPVTVLNVSFRWYFNVDFGVSNPGYSSGYNGTYVLKNLTLQLRLNPSSSNKDENIWHNYIFKVKESSLSIRDDNPRGKFTLPSIYTKESKRAEDISTTTAGTTMAKYSSDIIINAKDSDGSGYLLCNATLADGDNKETLKLSYTFEIKYDSLRRTLTYLNEDGSVNTTLNWWYNANVIIKGVPNKPDFNDSGTYKVTYNPDGGSPTPKTVEKTWTQKTTYSDGKWGNYSPGTQISIISDLKLKLNYVASSSPKSYSKLGNLPSGISKIGYKFDGNWYYNKNKTSPASANDEVKGNITLYPGWTANQYNITLNKNCDDSKVNIDIQTSLKIYGNNYIIPIWNPNRFGYNFDGWTDKKDGANIVVKNDGKSVNIELDNIYNSINTAATNNGITLYAKWTPIDNHYKFEYYIKNPDGSDPLYALRTDKASYNIETKSFRKGRPSIDFGDDDYSFLGWTATKSALFTSSQGGVDISDNLISCVDPFTLTETDIKNVKEWNGNTTTLYGYRTISGKRIFINGKWETVTGCWVKTQESNEQSPTWKFVTNVMVKTEDGWKNEIGRTNKKE